MCNIRIWTASNCKLWGEQIHLNKCNNPYLYIYICIYVYIYIYIYIYITTIIIKRINTMVGNPYDFLQFIFVSRITSNVFQHCFWSTGSASAAALGAWGHVVKTITIKILSWCVCPPNCQMLYMLREKGELKRFWQKKTNKIMIINTKIFTLLR